MLGAPLTDDIIVRITCASAKHGFCDSLRSMGRVLSVENGDKFLGSHGALVLNARSFMKLRGLMHHASWLMGRILSVESGDKFLDSHGALFLNA